jgi:hypothetical protein
MRFPFYINNRGKLKAYQNIYNFSSTTTFGQIWMSDIVITKIDYHYDSDDVVIVETVPVSYE